MGGIWVLLLAALVCGPVQGKRAEVLALRTLERDVRAPDPGKRRSAVKKLAALGSKPAWLAVFEALADKEPEVADEAQVQLAELGDERLLKRLLGKQGLQHRDPWVALRVAEALGRMQLTLDGFVLARALDARRPDYSRALLWSLERLALRDACGARDARLLRAIRPYYARNRPPDLRASALSTLVAVDRAACERELRAGLSDRDASVRCAAIALLRGTPAAFERTRPRVRDEHFAVRVEARASMFELANRAGLSVLVEGLEFETRPRLRWQLVEQLQTMTGRRYRLDVRPWRDFVAGLPSDWTVSAQAPAAKPGNRTVAFAGLPILSDHVAFLVDFSGSLWRVRDDGRSRKQILDEKLRAMFKRLPEATRFNLIPYSHAPVAWQERLQPAKSKAVKQAVTFFEKCRIKGSGNFYDAAMLALSDPDVDTIVTLTDGAPTGGKHWNLELMMALLVEESRYRAIAFDSILIDAPGGLRRHWQQLASRTGGRSIAISFDP